MTKIALYLIMCSVVAGEFMAPVQMDTYYDDMYTWHTAGYKESIDKSIEIGRSDVNQHEIYIKFICRQIELIVPPGKPV